MTNALTCTTPGCCDAVRAAHAAGLHQTCGGCGGPVSRHCGLHCFRPATGGGARDLCRCSEPYVVNHMDYLGRVTYSDTCKACGGYVPDDDTPTQEAK